LSQAAPFTFPVRVYWEDTDAGGVVYHAQYAAFLERARSEWLRALGYSQTRISADFGLVFVVRALRMEFLKPARLDDALAVALEVTQRRRASVLLAQTITRNGEPLLTAEVKLAVLDAASFTPRALPASLAPLFSPVNLREPILK